MKILSACLLLTVLVSGSAGADRLWDQGKAKRLVTKVLEVEKAKTRPWNKIPWRSSVDGAVREAKRARKPLFVFFYLDQEGPPLERCGLEGRLLRTHALSNATVAARIRSAYVPVKVRLEQGKEFPLNWPALKKWATEFKFSDARGFAGCSIVSYDLALEYGNSGSTKLANMMESPAFDAKAFATMLNTVSDRVTEERSLRAQRGIKEFERLEELKRFREGVARAVRSEGWNKLPPRGYSLEQALELYAMAGTKPKK